MAPWSVSADSGTTAKTAPLARFSHTLLSPLRLVSSTCSRALSSPASIRSRGQSPAARAWPACSGVAAAGTPALGTSRTLTVPGRSR